jgi:hypothetical protein
LEIGKWALGEQGWTKIMHAKIAITANTAPKKAERAASANDDP